MKKHHDRTNQFDLVALKVADHVPPDIKGERSGLLRQLGRPVLAEVAVSGLVSGSDQLERLALAYRHQRHIARIPPDACRGRFDASTDGSQSSGNHANVTCRSVVPSRRWE